MDLNCVYSLHLGVLSFKKDMVLLRILISQDMFNKLPVK